MQFPTSTLDAAMMNDVAAELTRVRSAQKPVNSAHEAYGLISEELAEFFEEVRKKREHRSPQRMHDELMQIATICIRSATDLGCVSIDPDR